ncbi:hypothetical protein [Niveispirillum lacus]|uniref:hypothetical protein n=1 Tax=Niveispirillum lacus TaxID=1981099 RepID=UPI0013FE29FD|nr:hypothetical protein [Niveispirillum lacus]
MRKAILVVALLALAGCGMKPHFPKAPPGSPPPKTYPDPASDPKPVPPSSEKPQQ